MANLRSLRVDLHLKETALRNSERTLKFLKNSSDTNIELIEEVERIIRQLKQQISGLEKSILKVEGVQKKK